MPYTANHKEKVLDDVIYRNGKEYRLVTLRNRSKYIAKDGDAINPYRPNQKVTIHYNSDGYPCYGGGVPIHLYVAHAWVDGYQPGYEVDHKDFNRLNYNANNLQWISHHDNIVRSVHENSDVWNKSRQGTHNGRAKFTEDEARKIKDLGVNHNWGTHEILEKLYPNIYGKERKRIATNIYNIIVGNTWKYLTV